MPTTQSAPNKYLRQIFSAVQMGKAPSMYQKFLDFMQFLQNSFF